MQKEIDEHERRYIVTMREAKVAARLALAEAVSAARSKFDEDRRALVKRLNDEARDS